MARYKLIRPTFENPDYKLAKKRQRIKNSADITWGVLIIAGIGIGGLYQTDSVITGWSLLIMGVFTLPLAVFYFYMVDRNWELFSWGVHPIDFRYVSKKKREKEQKENHFLIVLVAILLTLLAIALIVFGILRLCGSI